MTDPQQPDESTQPEPLDRIQSPHDRLLNQALQQVHVARTLIAQHL